MIRQTGQRTPAANDPFNTSDGKFQNPPLLVNDSNRNFEDSTKGSSTVPSTVAGYKAPPGGKSPSLGKPARMRNR